MDAHTLAVGISPAAELVDEIGRGRMVIVLDQEDRENEGDLIIAAERATPEAINFMAQYGRGLICLALTPERAGALGLKPIPRRNSEEDSAFADSIDAISGVSTGISAGDRARTIAAAIDPRSLPQDFASPGHMFPLIGRPRGLLERPGHTEAGIDLARLAGMAPAAVICEILNDDGGMARLPDLRIFAAHHQLKLGTVDGLIAHRRALDDTT